MSAPDFAAIIASAQWTTLDTMPRGILVAKVPELCPECEGSGKRPDCPLEPAAGEPCPFCEGRPYSHTCTHRKAPTIAKLLAIGAAVMGEPGAARMDALMEHAV